MADEFAQVQRVLSKLPDRLKRKVVVGAAAASARVVAKEAKALVPVRSGLLKKSIGIAMAKKQPNDAVRYFIMPKRRVNITAKVAVGGQTGKLKAKAASYHGHFVEFGTHKMSAQPYLYPAAERKKDELVRVFREKIHSGVEREVARLAR